MILRAFFVSLAATGVVAAISSGAAALRNAGTANGWLKVNGKEIPLKYAYGVADAPEFAMPALGMDGFDLLVTDKPLSEADLECRTLVMLRVKKGDLHGIILAFNPANKGPHNGNLLYGKQSPFFSILPESEEHRFEPGSLSREGIKGKVLMPKEQDVTLPGADPLKFQYEAAVEASVRRPGPVTATLTGKAAQESPQARALVAFCKAGRDGSMTGLQAAGVKEQVAALQSADGKDLLNAVRQSLPDPAKLKVTKVMIRGNMAVLQGSAPEPVGQLTMKCLREGSAWKISLN